MQTEDRDFSQSVAGNMKLRTNVEPYGYRTACTSKTTGWVTFRFTFRDEKVKNPSTK